MSLCQSGIAYEHDDPESVLQAVAAWAKRARVSLSHIEDDELRGSRGGDWDEYDFVVTRHEGWTALLSMCCSLPPALVLEVSRALGVRALSIDVYDVPGQEHFAIVERGRVTTRFNSLPEPRHIGVDWRAVREQHRLHCSDPYRPPADLFERAFEAWVERGADVKRLEDVAAEFSGGSAKVEAHLRGKLESVVGSAYFALGRLAPFDLDEFVNQRSGAAEGQAYRLRGVRSLRQNVGSGSPDPLWGGGATPRPKRARA